MIDNFLEVFMDDFSVFGCSFDACLANFFCCVVKIWRTLLWVRKSHYLVQMGIILAHKILRGIEVDNTKVDLIYNLPVPTFVRQVNLF